MTKDVLSSESTEDPESEFSRATARQVARGITQASKFELVVATESVCVRTEQRTNQTDGNHARNTQARDDHTDERTSTGTTR